MIRHKQEKNTPFLDFLFNMLGLFMSMFFLLILQLSIPKQEEKRPVPHGEFFITMEWDSSLHHDLDLWVEGPGDVFVWYNQREHGLLHLDRDDRGHINDIIRLPNGKTITYKKNLELVTLRGIQAGEYIVNVHFFDRSPNLTQSEEQLAEPVLVHFQLQKINPYSIVNTKTIQLKREKEEKTAFRFVLDAEGNVIEITEIEKSIIKNQLGYQNNYTED